MKTTAGRTVVLAATGALSLALLGGSTSSAGQAGWESSFDLTAAAHPGPAEPRVNDTAYDVGTSHRWVVQADTTASASAICNRCRGNAGALQVLYVEAPRATELNNVAAAWSTQCRRCRTTALSVQVVVVRGDGKVIANNRALATNAACTRCSSKAAAYQLVVVTDSPELLSPAEMDELRAWVERQAEALRRASGSAGRPASRPRARGPVRNTSAIENLVTRAVDGTTLSADTDLRSR